MMNKILGIGIDVVNISRFKKIKLSQGNKFLTRIFTKSELDYCFSKKNVALHLATKYAGKEAVVKAFGLIDKTNFDYKEIEITSSFSGVPQVKLTSNKAKKYKIIISLSNETDQAIGVVILIDE